MKPYFILLLIQSVLFGQMSAQVSSASLPLIEPFPPKSIEMSISNDQDKLISAMFNDEVSLPTLKSRYKIIWLKGEYGNDTKMIDRIVDSLNNGDEFQISIDGKIINPLVTQFSPRGDCFLFRNKDQYGNLTELYLYDLGKRKSYLILDNNSLTYGYKPIFYSNKLIIAHSGRYDNGGLILIDIGSLNVSIIQKGKGSSLNLKDISVSNTNVIENFYIRTKDSTYSFLDLSKKINASIVGFSDDFKYGFSENSIYDMKKMKLIYSFNTFYKIRSIQKNLITLSYQGRQIHRYEIDRVLVFGKYLNEIKNEFASIAPKDEFETESESLNRIAGLKDAVMKKYENKYTEERKILIKKIIDSYSQLNLNIDNIGTYIPEKEEFPITISGMSGTLRVPRSEAKDFKLNIASAKSIGYEQLDEGGNTKITFNIKVSNPLTGSVYPFGLQLKPLYVEETKVASAESGVPTLDMIAKFIEPSNNQLLDGNEVAYIEVSVTNKGTGTARDLRFNLEVPKIPGLYTEQAQSLTGIAPGQSNSIKFKVSSDRNLPTLDNLEFKISATEWKGFNPAPVIVNIKSQAFREPKLQFIEAGITEITGNNNNIIENNEIVEASALIQNKGQGIARNVKIAFNLGDKNIISTSPEKLFQTIDSLNPGEDKVIKFRFAVNNEYSGSDQLPMSIKLSEIWNQYGSENLLGLQLKKVTLAAKNVKYDGELAKEVKINDISLTSDIDKNIPENNCDPSNNKNRYALIIGNENYSKYQTGLNSESNVDFAINDAVTFSKYAEKTLCIPKENITFLPDAISSVINQQIQRHKDIIRYTQNGDAELFVFYAGHGFPDEITKESYLMPVDISGSNVKNGISLSNLYKDLTEFPSSKVIVMLDACFSGGGRNAGLLEARGVKIKPKEEAVKGNLVVFSASSGEQSSLPNKEKQHGMFSYYLMKKLQETKGDVTLGDLAEYIEGEVQLNSVKLNNKSQNPVVLTSSETQNIWKSMMLKK